MVDTRHMDPEDFVQSEEAQNDFDQDNTPAEGLEASHEAQPALAVQNATSFFSRIKWGRVALACIFAFLVLAAVLFVWNRWYRFDDVTDIQGTWRDVTSGATMEVNESYIKLADDAVYEYSIDTTAKTISYSFAGDEGFSSYRFSEDRQKLVLEDGVGTDWGLVFHFHDDPGFVEGDLAEGLTRLEKVSDEVPAIKLPGSNRPAGALVQSKPQTPASSSSSAAASSNAGGSLASSSSDNTPEEKETSSAPRASQTEPDENGLVVGPDRNAKGYYDSEGIFVPVTNGHFDESGNWVDSDEEGYYDQTGTWVAGTWYDNSIESAENVGSEDTLAYDDGSFASEESTYAAY